MSYVFIRKAESNPPNYAQIAQSGATVALNSEDPHLQEEMDKAKQNGAKVAIWFPAHQGQDPTAYARNMAAFAQQYKPTAVLPNLEGPQNKYSSGGGPWSQTMMSEYMKYVPPNSGVGLSVVTEPGETDFDYKPYLNYGGDVVNEAFLGDMTQKNPDELRQKLIEHGVPADRINMLLAPGQSPGSSGNFSAYTWDDMNEQQRSTWLQNYSSVTNNGTVKPTPGANPVLTPGGGPSQWSRPLIGGSSKPGPKPPPAGGDDYNQVPSVEPTYSQVKDKANPAAVNYAKMRLQTLAAMGYTPEDFGLQGADPTEQWRQMSALIGFQQAQKAGQGAQYAAPANINAGVAAEIARQQSQAVGTGSPAAPIATQPRNLAAAKAIEVMRAQPTPPKLTPIRQPWEQGVVSAGKLPQVVQPSAPQQAIAAIRKTANTRAAPKKPAAPKKLTPIKSGGNWSRIS